MATSSRSRRDFIQRFSLTAAGLALPALLPAALAAQTTPAATPPPLPPDLVKAFVVAGHGNLPKVKELLAETPSLLNASWDWKNGDFETALEGAGHVGNREAAEHLLSLGARANIFVFVMLGQLELVKALLAAYPGLRQSRGPHGLGFVHHATKGGEAAQGMLEYLQREGLK